MRWPSSTRAKIGVAATALILQACSASPSQDILGSFFPSWLLCALIGVVATVFVRWRLIVAGIDRFIPLALVTYAAMAFALTCLIWLLRFGN